jgi:hypothetical protein
MPNKLNHLPFTPVRGLFSPHAQTALSCICPPGTPPLSIPKIIFLNDGDALTCEISTPSQWKPTDKTILLVHGLGGSHESSYMVRLSRKCWEKGYRAIRLNMRACGNSSAYATRPYHGGVSQDLHEALLQFKKEAPESPIYLIGFSLGGNIALKLGGELGDEANDLLAMTIAICPPVDLGQTSAILSRPNHQFYNKYYIRHLAEQTAPWTGHLTFSTIYEYDQLVTAPNWNFKSPNDYYKKCSSRYFLPMIKHPCRIIFTADDPFIDYRCCIDEEIPGDVSFWISDHGGHMGFFGWSDATHKYYWLDYWLFNWLDELS